MLSIGNNLFTNVIGTRIDAPAPSEVKKVTTPPAGEATPAQSILPGLGSVSFNMTVAKSPVGALNTRGSYAKYREMMGDSTIELAYAVIVGPMFAAPWSIEGRTGVSPAWIESVKRQFLNDRDELLDECGRAVIFGWRSFENVWKPEKPTQDLLDAVDDAVQKLTANNQKDTTGGDPQAPQSPDEPTNVSLPPVMWWIDRFKALKPEKTNVLVNQSGQLLGVRQLGVDLLVSDRKVWIFTHDREGDNWYGRSRLENIVRDYHRREKVEEHAERTSAKGAGVKPIISHPPTPQQQQGQPAPPDFHQFGIAAAEALMGDGYVVVENTWAGADAVRTTPNKVGESPWGFNVWNAGEVGGTLGQLQARLAYYDARFFRGMLRPEREALAQQRGGIGTSDAISHGDIGTQESERLHKLILKAINKGPVNDFLEVNFGAEARDAVWIKAADLNDDVRALFIEIYKLLLTNPATSDWALANLDLDSVQDTIGVPINRDVADPGEESTTAEPGGVDPSIAKVAQLMTKAMQAGKKPPAAEPQAA